MDSLSSDQENIDNSISNHNTSTNSYNDYLLSDQTIVNSTNNSEILPTTYYSTIYEHQDLDLDSDGESSKYEHKKKPEKAKWTQAEVSTS